jgi:PPOX class probable F420-dependent enzyme
MLRFSPRIHDEMYRNHGPSLGERMILTDEHRAFLEQHHRAAMVTLRADGTPHAVRVGVALVDGKLWSSGTKDRVRTGHLRQDPRSTVFVFDPTWRWLTLETLVTILEGPDVPQLSLRLFQVMQAQLPRAPASGHVMWAGQERSIDEFFRIMVAEQRLIYQFEIKRVYGLV